MKRAAFLSFLPMVPNASVELDALRLELDSPTFQILIGLHLALVAVSGVVLLPLVIISFLSSTNVLSKTAVINCLIGFSVHTVGILILPISGHLLNPSPPSTICLAQIAFLYGGLLMATVAALLILIQVLLVFPKGDPPTNSKPQTRALRLTLVSLPFMALLLYIPIQIAAWTSRPAEVIIARNPLWCKFDHKAPFLFRKGPGFMLILGLLLVAVFSVYMWLRVRLALRRIGVWPNWRRMMQTEHASLISFLLRMVIFEVACLAAAGFILLDTTTEDDYVHLIAEAFAGLLPLWVFLNFGTVESVRKQLLGWCFRVRVHIPKDKCTDVETLSHNP